MGSRGPKPKPQEVKEAQGTARKVRLPKARHRIGRTTCPKWLDGYAKEEWRRLGPRLTRAGILRADTRLTFAAYCAAASTVREALESKAKATEDTEKAKALNLLDRGMKHLRSYSHQLGLGEIFESEGDTDEGQRKRKALSLLT